MKNLFKRTKRSVSHGIEQFILVYGFIYIGKRMIPEKGTHYQIGYQIKDWMPAMFLNFKNKPFFREGITLNILFFLPYILFLIINVFKGVCAALFWLITYCTYGYIKHGIKDFGWSKRYLIIPILIWKLIAIIFILLYIFK